MGAYSTKPVTEKISRDEKCTRFSYGSSSMQGWRISQEDAHNCIIDFDEDTSFFAVYDGHGGVEVAKYCALHLPDCFRSVVSYKNGNITQALEEAFLEFDACLTKPEVIEELKHLSGLSDDSEDEDMAAEDARALNEEAHMPLEDLLARYKGAPLPLKVAPHMRNYHNQKPKSPMLRAKKQKIENEKNELSKEGQQLVNGDSGSTSDSFATNGKVCSETGNSKASTQTGAESNEVQKDKQTSAASSVESPVVEAEPGCSHPKERTVKKKNKEIASSSEDEGSDDEEEGDEEYSVGDSSEDDDEENDENDEDEEKEDSSEDEDSDDDEDARLEVAKIEEPGKDSGCTAVVAVLCGNQLYVANAGDSRCVVSRNNKALDMSFDHKPEDQTERLRIEKAGGEVTSDGRVNGGLNLSRAIGDHLYKKNEALSSKEQMISAQPDIQTLTIDPAEDQFMVLACDGIWNSMSSQEVVDFVHKHLKEGKESLSGICEKLFDHCLAPDTMGDGTGCDNMTCIIVRFSDLCDQDSKRKRPSFTSELGEDDFAKKPKVDDE